MQSCSGTPTTRRFHGLLTLSVMKSTMYIQKTIRGQPTSHQNREWSRESDRIGTVPGIEPVPTFARSTNMASATPTKPRARQNPPAIPQRAGMENGVEGGGQGWGAHPLPNKLQSQQGGARGSANNEFVSDTIALAV